MCWLVINEGFISFNFLLWQMELVEVARFAKTFTKVFDWNVWNKRDQKLVHTFSCVGACVIFLVGEAGNVPIHVWQILLSVQPDLACGLTLPPLLTSSVNLVRINKFIPKAGRVEL